MSSVLIISNDEKTGKLISEKVKLLRECDNIQSVTYIESISVLNTTQPSLMIVYSSGPESIGIVKEIRALKTLDKVPIVLVMDYFVEDMLLYAFDNGIDDFFFLNDSDAVILMRIIFTLQKSILYDQLEIRNDVLLMADITDKQTGIFKKEQTPFVFKHFFSKSIEENMEGTIFLCIKPVPLSNKRVKMHEAANILKTIPRGNDIIAYGKNSTFYFILYEAGEIGAKSVAQKISRKLSDEYKVYANAAEITTSFEEMEPVLLQSLKDQISMELEFNYMYDLTLNEAVETMDIHDETGKKFKDFKKEFYTGFEKIISPVFFQVQSKASQMLPESKVNFEITENESKFVISGKKVKSELLITYPSYMKLIIDIKHSSGTKNKYVRRLTFDFEDFSADKLLSILEDILKEFKNRLEERADKKSVSKSK